MGYFCIKISENMVMSERERLAEVYQHLKQLKHNGVKMKNIADDLDISPSVLSALYATVLPVFCNLVDNRGTDAALDEALSNVNNLSRKRMFEILDKLEVYFATARYGHFLPCDGTHPFFCFLKETVVASSRKLGNLEGVYMSYSCSSSVRALKAEPFYFSIGNGTESFVVGRKSIHNSIREGIGIIQERQILYLLLNAFQEPNMSLVTVYLQLPFLESIHILKGIYMVPDYNKNPIARRIVLVKLCDEYIEDDFRQIEAKIIMQEDFDQDLRMIYDYTCGKADSIKMCTLPSPRLNLTDLNTEKKLLDKEEEFED